MPVRATRFRGSNHGFTLLEVIVVVGIVAVVSALAVPAFISVRDNQRLRDSAATVADSLRLARALAISTGRNHVVYFAANSPNDICGNPLVDVNGNPVPVLVLDDGRPGAATNCCIDPAETTFTEPAELGVNWGRSFAAAAVGTDTGLGDHTTGSSFADPAGVQTGWVMFRPDGVPVGFDAACTQGAIGSGGGGIYVTNTTRDVAVVLSPLGTVRVHPYDNAAAAWEN